MEFVTGVKEKEAMELPEVIIQEEGTEVIVEGAIHSIRNMGDVAFVILRRREGLFQTVFEKGRKTRRKFHRFRRPDARRHR